MKRDKLLLSKNNSLMKKSEKLKILFYIIVKIPSLFFLMSTSERIVFDVDRASTFTSSLMRLK